MPPTISKTDYLLFRECPKNVWYKLHQPDIYQQGELSEFEKAIMETGNEVELVARQLFPAGIMIGGRGEAARKKTEELLAKKERVVFQPVFAKDGFLAAADVLARNGNGSYSLYEIKSTNDIDEKTHYHDVAFQVNLLEGCGLEIASCHLIHLNKEYVRRGELEIVKLFKIEDVTERVRGMRQEVAGEMQAALRYLSQEEEPIGPCSCIEKGRSSWCSTAAYANSQVPEYGVHDITRIGASKAKLQALVDVGIFELHGITEEVLNTLSLPQQNQVLAYVHDKVLIDRRNIAQELGQLIFPLHFLDYETFPCAIPRFDGFSPYQQIPFQYSLYVMEDPGAQLRHFEFLFTRNEDPSRSFAESLQKHLSSAGTIIVWNKNFECKINREIAKRQGEYKNFMESVNARVYDLMDIFSKQLYVHKDFLGRVSIKNVMPVLAPELSYKALNIQEGGTASQSWNTMVNDATPPAARQKIAADLKAYCKLDTYAMYAIWKHLVDLVA